jgi:hypothetical protein
MEHRMHDMENTLAEIAAIRSQMAGSMELRGQEGGTVPNAAAADRAGARL